MHSTLIDHFFYYMVIGGGGNYFTSLEHIFYTPKKVVRIDLILSLHSSHLNQFDYTIHSSLLHCTVS